MRRLATTMSDDEVATNELHLPVPYCTYFTSTTTQHEQDIYTLCDVTCFGDDNLLAAMFWNTAKKKLIIKPLQEHQQQEIILSATMHEPHCIFSSVGPNHVLFVHVPARKE